MRELLSTGSQTRRFLGLAAQSTAGNSIAYIALLIVALERNPANWSVSAALIAETLPMIAVAAWFGARSDRGHRRRFLVIADLVRAAVFASIALTGSFYLTVFLIAIAGAADAAYMPISKAALGDVAGEQYEPAMRIMISSLTTMQTVGPALAAGLLLVMGAPMLLLLNAATFLLSAAVLMTVAIPDQPKTGASGEEAEAPLESPNTLRVTWQTMGTVHRLRSYVLVSACLALPFALINVAEPLLFLRELGSGESGFAGAVFAYGLGAIGGSLLGQANARRATAAMIATSLAFGAMLIVPGIALAYLVMFVGGFFCSMVIASMQLLLTSQAPESHRGAVFGFHDTLESSAILVAYLAGAGLVTLLRGRAIYGLCALGLLIAAAVSWWIWRTIREVDPQEAHVHPEGL
jgi:NRE family putative nickel resistance protein-like MFS transporter